MTLQLRPFTEDDFDLFLALADAAVPFDHEGNKEVLRNRQRFDETRYKRRHYVVEESETGKAVGYGAIEQQETDAREFRIFIVTASENLWRSVGEYLFDRLLTDLRQLEATRVWAREYQQDTDIVTFYQEHGFVPGQRLWDMRMPLSHTDVAASSPDKLADQGIFVTSLAQAQQRNANHAHQLHELVNQILALASPSDSFTPIPWQRFTAWIQQPDIVPAVSLIIKHNDAYRGLHLLAHDDAPRQLVQRFAGIREAYRQEAILAVLRKQTVTYAREHNYQRIVAYVPAEQTAWLQTNERLGFGRHFEYITLEKKL